MYVNSATSTSRKSGFARIACVAGLTAVLVGEAAWVWLRVAHTLPLHRPRPSLQP